MEEIKQEKKEGCGQQERFFCIEQIPLLEKHFKVTLAEIISCTMNIQDFMLWMGKLKYSQSIHKENYRIKCKATALHKDAEEIKIYYDMVDTAFNKIIEIAKRNNQQEIINVINTVKSKQVVMV